MGKQFVPREYQELMIEFPYSAPRCGIWAGMGAGKTSSTLTYIDQLDMQGVTGPTLVLAPLLVAKTSWVDEANKWDHLSGLRVVPVVGSEMEKRKALRYDANVFTTNYESLPWLVEYFGKRWPFRTVVCDESTRLKSFRLRKGSLRAKALGRVAHTHIDRLIELTGTPSPNGIQDLWGQIWMLDAGERLGRSYQAFKDRWFSQGFDGYGVRARENSQEEIQNKLKDICITIDLKDWLDLKEPFVTNKFVELPPKARQLYKEMEDKFFFEIDDYEVEAVHAAARSQKLLQMCIAEGTDVLTQNGWKAIESLNSGDMLWDGVEWVNFQALTTPLQKTVIECDGVFMTPTHRVLTEGGWATAEDALNGDAQELRRFRRKEVRLPYGYKEGRIGKPESNVEMPVRLREGSSAPESITEEQTPTRTKKLRMQTRAVAYLSREDVHPEVPHLERDETALHKPLLKRLPALWRSGDNSVRGVASLFRNILQRHGRGVLRRVIDRTYRQLERIFQGELSMGYGAGARREYSREPRTSYTQRAYDPHTSSGVLRAEQRDAARTHPPVRTPGAEGSTNTTKRVLDVISAGRRNRFTVRGREGQIFIVHNCNGAVYVNPDVDDDNHPQAKFFKELHDVKIQALESIVEESAGMPVLVAYSFKSDLKRLLKAFPKGVALSSDNGVEIMPKWNKGEIPIMFAHPASAGHGLNLQDGGNILVYFGINWNLEHRLQIMERLGPVRQFQAGHNRPVFIYNILARDTIDELVLARVETKREVQDILMDAMTRRRGNGGRTHDHDGSSKGQSNGQPHRGADLATHIR